MLSRKICLILLVPGLCGLSRAYGDEEPSKRPNRDIEFAYTLSGAQWYDLALQVVDELRASHPEADVAEQATMAWAEIQRSHANSPAMQKDPKKREEIQKQVRALYEELVKSKPDTEAGTEAQLALGEMLLQEGDAAFSRMRTTDDPDARAQSRKEAEDKYTAAEKYFDALKGKFQSALDAAGSVQIPENLDEKQQEEAEARNKRKVDDAAYRACNAYFCHARSVYQGAQLFDKGSKDRDERLNKAMALFNDVNTNFGDQFQGRESAIYLGLISKDLGNNRQAYDAFYSVLGIKEDYLNRATGKYQFDDRGRDLVARASYFMAQAMNEIKDFDTALKSVKELFELLPELQRDPLGYAARVEEGKAWAGKGDVKRAQQVLEKVIDEDKGGAWAASAKEALGLLGGNSGGGLTIAPERMIASAESLIDRGHVAEGLNQLRNVIALVERGTPEEQQKWLPDAWMKLGNAYNALKRYDEAVAAYDALVSRFKKCDQASTALFKAATACLQVNGAHANDFDKSGYKARFTRLQTEYPDDPVGKASSYFLGVERFAARDYTGAAQEFERTNATAGKLYDAALYQAGLAYDQEARRLAAEKQQDVAGRMFAKARAAFERAIKWASGEAAAKAGFPPESERALSLKRIAFDSRLKLASLELQPLNHNAAKALEAAKAAEEGLGQGADADRIAEARLLIVEAHLAAQDLDKAEEVVASMGTASGASPRTAQAEREVAISVDNDAKKHRQDGKADEAKTLFSKAADHLTRWFEVAQKAGMALSAKDLSKAADRLYTLALIVNGLPENQDSFADVEDLSKLEAAPRFTTAATVYGAAVEANAPDPWLLEVRRGECCGFARDFEKAAKALKDTCEHQKLLKAEKATDDDGKPITIYTIDDKVASANTLLLFAYADYGRCCYEIGLKDRKELDEAIAALGRVLGVCPSGQPIWWRAKYYLLSSLTEKGEYKEALIGLKQLERQNPGFDDGKYGLKDRFAALKAKLEAKAAPGK